MKGFVFHGPGQSSWEDVPDPGLKDPTDAIVRVDTVTICGTDLHILKGDVPEVRPGKAHSRPWAGGKREHWVRIDPRVITGRRITAK